jgi:two-component system KDP operon response regulator KdpE
MSLVLLIEPDKLLADTYASALTAVGHQVVVRAGAQAAVTAADEKTPDLVILELQLVNHSGLDFLYEFRSYPDWQQIPIIINTFVPLSEFNDSLEILNKELNISKYLYKPKSNLRQLIRTLTSCLSLNTLQ